MRISFRPIDKEAARSIIAWRYDPPYDAYDILDPPDEVIPYLLQADVNAHVLDVDGELVGFCTFGHDARIPGGAYDADALDIGLGIRPDLTGQGRGRDYVAAVIDHGLSTFQAERLRVSIAEWNERALKAWSSAGFVEVDRFTTAGPVMKARQFVILVRGT